MMVQKDNVNDIKNAECPWFLQIENANDIT